MRRDFNTDGDIKVDLKDIDPKWDNRAKEYGEKEPRWAKMAMIGHHADDGFATGEGAYFFEIVTVEIRRVKYHRCSSTPEWEVSARGLNKSITNEFQVEDFHGELVATRDTKKEAMAVAEELLKRQWTLENRHHQPELFVPSFKAENKTYENEWEDRFATKLAKNRARRLSGGVRLVVLAAA